MSVDKVKPLKLETTIDGSSNDPFPREADPSQDYLAAKGLSFEDLDTYLLQKIGNNISPLVPDRSNKINYLVNGEVDYVELYTSASQITANRIIRVDMTYDGSLNPTSEVWKFYDTNGTTILRTLTLIHTFTGTDYTETVTSTI